MNRHHASRSRMAVMLLAGMAVLPLSACQPGARTAGTAVSAATTQASSTSSSVTAAAPVATAPVATAPATGGTSAGRGVGGPGSLTVSITSPITVAGHVDTTVSCDTGRRYVESASGVIHGYTVTATVRIAAYHGAGSYPAVVTVSVGSSTDGPYAVEAIATTATITSSGGSLSFTGQTAAGRTLAGSISWSCSA
ncbi:hypothetical protein [Frankia sp. CiP3]|uniref:hypothetical protein n=1 Tax=Frankia sp. CiP3 TaxID=2880971 RepID=UPI001EF62D3F|nr:hypothetical protein [Frankia sp. CiP3]